METEEEDEYHVIQEWYDNGQLRASLGYKNNKLHGLCRVWYENGQLEYKCFYLNDKLFGKWDYWFPCGQKNISMFFVDDNQTGLCTLWWPNGNLKMKAFYYKSKLHGSARYYDRRGVEKFRDRYYNGIRYTINAVLKIQRWVRRVFLSRSMVRLVRDREFIKIYYHPERKGGWFHKKRLLEYVEGLTNKRRRKVF